MNGRFRRKGPEGLKMQLRRFVPAMFLAVAATFASAQTPAPAAGGQTGAPASSTGAVRDQKSAPPKTSAPTVITPQQAKELFASVGTILKFVSKDTGLPVHHPVKARLVTRPEVEQYLQRKLNDGKDARRMERSEIVLKKFGLLDADFRLRPFLVKLLDEQIAAYYDSRTKTVNLLNWVAPATQKPVLAQELTHALQDQDVDLEKWEDPSSDGISHSYAQDVQHVATDEEDTAREAVVEGQAMVSFVDYSLAPTGRSLKMMPGLAKKMVAATSDLSDSPVMARAPMVLQQSMLFPYTYGLEFEATLLQDSATKAGAFADVLARPPNTSYEIMNPRAYERHVKPPLLTMPDIHPVIDAEYNPYDVGVMGELDVKILADMFGGREAEAELTPQWDGGIYYVAQKKGAKNTNSTASVALLYVSQWKTRRAAEVFAKLYDNQVGNQFWDVKREKADETGPNERVYTTSEGPVLIVRSGREVFVSESFALPMARKLQWLTLSAQQQSGGQLAMSGRRPGAEPAPRREPDLTGSLVQWMASCGMMKAALAEGAVGIAEANLTK